MSTCAGLLDPVTSGLDPGSLFGQSSCTEPDSDTGSRSCLGHGFDDGTPTLLFFLFFFNRWLGWNCRPLEVTVTFISTFRLSQSMSGQPSDHRPTSSQWSDIHLMSLLSFFLFFKQKHSFLLSKEMSCTSFRFRPKASEISFTILLCFFCLPLLMCHML